MSPTAFVAVDMATGNAHLLNRENELSARLIIKLQTRISEQRLISCRSTSNLGDKEFYMIRFVSGCKRAGHNTLLSNKQKSSLMQH